MNEREIASLVRRALDDSVERLPYRITHRLAAARALALARSTAEVRRPVAAPRPSHAASAEETEVAGDGSPKLRWRIAAVVVPIVVVAAGLAGISAWDSWQRASDIADLDAAMLADDVPIAAYADRGFGVYLKNVSQAREE